MYCHQIHNILCTYANIGTFILLSKVNLHIKNRVDNKSIKRRTDLGYKHTPCILITDVFQLQRGV